MWRSVPAGRSRLAGTSKPMRRDAVPLHAPAWNDGGIARSTRRRVCGHPGRYGVQRGVKKAQIAANAATLLEQLATECRKIIDSDLGRTDRNSPLIT
jgi:hypothetical protein